MKKKTWPHILKHFNSPSEYASSLLSHYNKVSFKTLDTLGNCRRPVFSLGVSQHMHKKQTCKNLSSICRWSCEIVMKKKTPLSHHGHTKLFDFRCLISRPQILNLRSQIEIKFVENYIFLENYVTPEGAVPHNVLYYQPLIVTRNQEKFYDNNYFE